MRLTDRTASGIADSPQRHSNAISTSVSSHSGDHDCYFRLLDAINRRELGRAYTYWNRLGGDSQQTFAQFAQGFSATAGVTVAMGTAQAGGAAGSVYATLPVVVVATQSDGSSRAFCGTYTLRRLNVPPFDQLGWRIEGAEVVALEGVKPGAADEKRLLSGGCPPKH